MLQWINRSVWSFKSIPMPLEIIFIDMERIGMHVIAPKYDFRSSVLWSEF